MHLSKSDFKVARECPSKLYYKKNKYPSLLDGDPFLEFLADGGYMVEKMAKLLFPQGIEMQQVNGSPESAFHLTLERMNTDQVTLFEPTILAGNLLARVDILEKVGGTIRLIEVKSASVNMAKDGPMPFRGKRGEILSTWIPYLEDITFQVLVLRRAFPNLEIIPILCVVDKSRQATENGTCDKFRLRQAGSGRLASDVEYLGNEKELQNEHVLAFIDVASEVAELLSEVEKCADMLADTIKGTSQQRVPPHLSLICKKCEYRTEPDQRLSGFSECWGDLAKVRPHVLEFYRPDGLRLPDKQDPISVLANQGKGCLLDIPQEWLAGAYAERQRIQLQHSCPEREFIAPELNPELDRHPYPLHFVDFEASRAVLPFNAGMHPYQLTAFQWSCHTIVEQGSEPIHTEWINLEPGFPNFDFARALKKAIGDNGTIYVWSPFEQTTLRDIRQHLEVLNENDAELAAWLEQLGASNCPRIVDMEKLVKKFHFHPQMGGRTSIKVVLPSVWNSNSSLWAHPNFRKYHRIGIDGIPLDPYKTLPPIPLGIQDEVWESVQEGTAAIRAYQDLIFGRGATSGEARDALQKLLLQYCELDTAAMVMIWMHWKNRPQPLNR